MKGPNCVNKIMLRIRYIIRWDVYKGKYDKSSEQNEIFSISMSTEIGLH